MADTLPAATTADAAPTATVPVQPPRRANLRWRIIGLTIGAIIFLFPFYYMIIGSLQKKKDTSLKGVLPIPSNMSLHNYGQINAAISLGQTLLNSIIFTAGVVLGTLVFGVVAGYALAQLHFRGRGVLFAAMLLLQVVPFQLLMIPLYVQIVRAYGLADSYLGMILPFLINSVAVFVFRQYFLQLPPDLFNSARIDGASELRILWSIALPLARPAVLTATLLTFIGPWNEFLWPFLITKNHAKQPLAVALANYISTLQASTTNPLGAILAGACVLAAPAIALFIAFQRHFVATDLSSGVKG
jgi:multiple sugar transport system permease protein